MIDASSNQDQNFLNFWVSQIWCYLKEMDSGKNNGELQMMRSLLVLEIFYFFSPLFWNTFAFWPSTKKKISWFFRNFHCFEITCHLAKKDITWSMIQLPQLYSAYFSSYGFSKFSLESPWAKGPGNLTKNFDFSISPILMLSERDECGEIDGRLHLIRSCLILGEHPFV